MGIFEELERGHDQRLRAEGIATERERVRAVLQSQETVLVLAKQWRGLLDPDEAQELCAWFASHLGVDLSTKEGS